MKYLLVIAFILIACWLWRQARESDREEAATAPPPGRKPSQPLLKATEVVACKICKVHLPRTEALTSSYGVFCCDAHRQQAEHQ